MISLHNVTMKYPVPKRYREYLFHPFRKNGAIAAVNNINLTVTEGDCLGLLGPNGAGKTTLLKLIGGLLYPTEGSVIVNGYNTQKNNLQARKSVGFVLNEDRSFYWRLTGIQNLEFFGVLDNLNGENLRERIVELLALVGLETVGNKRVGDYSSGMRQRLAIARGLLTNPEVLILDEPTKALDPLGAESLRNIISKNIHSENKKTLIIATHQIEEAEMLCNKIGILTSGCITDFVSATELSNKSISLNKYYKTVLTEPEPTQC
jgi:ABC-2 type transport system ATP-binding protein